MMDMFNNFIGDHCLREVIRAGPRYTWTKKQNDPIMVNLDRFLVSLEWESRFPLCMAWSLTRVGSDHSPIILDYGEQGAPRPKYFYFEKQWLMHSEIYDLVKIKWQESEVRRPNSSYSLDSWHGSFILRTSWHGSLCYLRRALKGWNLQKIGEQKQTKKVLLQQLSRLNATVEDGPIPADHWQQRYELENKLESIYNLEEIYWQQRGSELWMLKGDSNTDFFHAFANGRRRKKTIIELETDRGVVKTQEEIMNHVTVFYKNLFGSQPHCQLRLDNNFWLEGRTLPHDEKENLIKPFLEEEVKKAIFEMRVDSAPGPNGFGVQFF
jgi:hypothetical protein